MTGLILNFFDVDLIEGFFSFFIGFCGLILFADVFIGQFVSEELHGVVIVAEEFVVPIDLIGESAFLGVVKGTAPSLMSSTGVWQ